MKTAKQIAGECSCKRQWVYTIAFRLGVKPEKVGDFLNVFSDEDSKKICEEIMKLKRK